jgi:tRNA (cytidine56-2'-O)-methyltransferase
MESEIIVLRLGHRLPRDERISTHVALVARAFGAKRIIYTGQHDSGLETSVSRVGASWGGEVTIKYEKSHGKVIKEFKNSGFSIVHLTMYGLPIVEKIEEIKKQQKLLIIVGGEAVPGEVYQTADFNIAVTSQPHSEVAALAIMLDKIMGGKELDREFDASFKGKTRIKPNERGKSFY